MKKFLLGLLIASLLPVSLYSQTEQDVIFLESGSIIRGIIIESSDEQIKIESCCGNIFVFNRGEIKNIEKEPVPKKDYKVKQKGYMNFTSMGVLLGSPTNDKIAPFSLLSEHVYRINKYVAAGGVIGYEMLEEALIPLGANVKGFVFDDARNLFLGITGGYSFSLENPNNEIFESTSGGAFFNFELGANIPVSSDNSFLIAVGYRYNALNYTRDDWWLGSVDRKVTYNRISIRLGLTIY